MRTTVSMIALAMGGFGCAGGNIHSGGTALYPPSNEVPVAGNFKTSIQLKLQAAEHWKRIANNSAGQLVKSLEQGGRCIPKHECATLYVRRNCLASGCSTGTCDTAFSRVFSSEFMTALVRLGYPVSSIPVANAIAVDLEIQTVTFKAGRPQYRYAGEPVEIGPGTWALRDAATLVDSQGAQAPRTDGYDANWYRAQFAGGETPRNEVVVTASALSPEKLYLARNTSIYYTSDADSSLYFCAPPNAPRSASNESQIWTIPVNGDCSAGRCIDRATRGQP